jgi:protein SCO1/2
MARTPDGQAGSPRFAIVALLFAAVVVLAAGVGLGFAFRDSPKGAAGTAMALLIGGPFHLIDQDRRSVTEAALQGKWHLVFFGYTHCPDACPTALNEIALALDRLGGKRDRVGVMLVTVDPERDTPDVLKAYLQSFDAPVLGLTGTPAEVAQIAKEYRVYYAKRPRPDGSYDMDHSAVIYLMDPHGRFTATFTPDTSAEDMAARLEKLLS